MLGSDFVVVMCVMIGLIYCMLIGMVKYLGLLLLVELFYVGMWVVDIVYFLFEIELIYVVCVVGCVMLLGGGMVVY